MSRDILVVTVEKDATGISKYRSGMLGCYSIASIALDRPPGQRITGLKYPGAEVGRRCSAPFAARPNHLLSCCPGVSEVNEKLA